MQQVIESVDQTTHIAKPSKQVISFSIDRLESLLKVDLNACELVKSSGISGRVLGPGA